MDERILKFDVVVVGAGPAGLSAACAAAESGARVGVVDETPWAGGQIWRGQPSSCFATESVDTKNGDCKVEQESFNNSVNPQARHWFERFHKSGGVLVERTSVLALAKQGVLLAEQSNLPIQIHWQKLILATGARERFIPFPGWTLPGIMGPGGLLSMAKNGWPVAGQRVLIAGSGPLLLAAAAGLHKLGANVISVSEQASFRSVAGFAIGLLARPSKIMQGIGLKKAMGGARYRCGVWPARADGDAQVRAVTLTNGTRTWEESCDVFACGFGLVPNLELALLLGCELNESFVKVDEWQATSLDSVYCAGEVTGISGADGALIEGQIAGHASVGERVQAKKLFASRSSWHRFRQSLNSSFALRSELKSLANDHTIVCRCEDVSLSRIRQFSNWRDAKLQSRCGMGACQGRICGVATQFLLGWNMESVRPPVLPARVQSLISCAPASHLPLEANERNQSPVAHGFLESK